MAEKMPKKKYYQCTRCEFSYTEKRRAKQCQEWCDKHKSCNLEITRYAVREHE